MNTYYNPDDLAKFGTMGEEAPALWDAFMAYYGGVMAEGALTAREKALIALAIAHADKCPYCIDSYTQTCLQMGIDEEEIANDHHKGGDEAHDDHHGVRFAAEFLIEVGA